MSDTFRGISFLRRVRQHLHASVGGRLRIVTCLVGLVIVAAGTAVADVYLRNLFPFLDFTGFSGTYSNYRKRRFEWPVLPDSRHERQNLRNLPPTQQRIRIECRRRQIPILHKPRQRSAVRADRRLNLSNRSRRQQSSLEQRTDSHRTDCPAEQHGRIRTAIYDHGRAGSVRVRSHHRLPGSADSFRLSSAATDDKL